MSGPGRLDKEDQDKLRKQIGGRIKSGETYREIQQDLRCSYSTISDVKQTKKNKEKSKVDRYLDS